MLSVDEGDSPDSYRFKSQLLLMDIEISFKKSDSKKLNEGVPLQQTIKTFVDGIYI